MFFENEMRQHGLLRPLKAAELSDGTLRYLLLMSPRFAHGALDGRSPRLTERAKDSRPARSVEWSPPSAAND